MLICMCMLDKKVHILFDNQLWNQIRQLAKEKNMSVGQLVRSAVEEQYGKDNWLVKRAKAIEEILALKKQYKTKSTNKEDVVTLVRRMREERTQHLWNILERNRKKSK